MSKNLPHDEIATQATGVRRNGAGSQAFLLLKSYPLPFVAALGLASGAAATLVAGQATVGDWIWYATLLIGGLPVVYHTLSGVLKGRFAADIVAMLAIITALLSDEAFAGVVIVMMQTGGEAIDDYGFRRASSSLVALASRAPRLAQRKGLDGKIQQIDVKDAVVGDTLVVRSGDLVPVDGVLTRGPAEIDESALTGEPLPRSKMEGDALMSGSVNVGQAFEMSATRLSTESQYSRIVELVRQAQQAKPPIQRLADRYAIVFTPLTLGVAGLGWLITGEVSTVLAVLVVATPCPLILATPLAVISGVNRAAKENIIVKSGGAIEQVGKARVVMFDKTGTLTYGVPVVERIVSLDGDADVILRKAASVEQYSSHPVAKALTEDGRKRFGGLDEPTNFIEVPGQGVEGDLAGEHIIVGSQKFCETRLAAPFDGKIQAMLGDVRPAGSMISFVGIAGKPSGAVVFTDEVRPGVPSMMLRLRELGIEETVMLTGDNKVNAEAIARQAGIERVEANLLPSQKVDQVRILTSEFGTSIMVGDGINDAPALASATVGVAMGAHGTGISSEAADIVLLVDDVTEIDDAISIGKRTLRIAKESIIIGMGASLVLMVIASFGYILPALGAGLQEVVDITVILNALRARS